MFGPVHDDKSIDDDNKSDSGDTISSISDSYTNIDDDDPSMFYSLFRNSIIKKPTMEEIMEKCLLQRQKDVSIDGEHIKTIPVEFAEFEWIEDMTIESTKINVFDVFPKELKSLTLRDNEIELFDASLLPRTLLFLKYNYNDTKDVIGLHEGISVLDMSSNNFILLKCKIPSSVVHCNFSGNRLLRQVPDIVDFGNLKILNLNDTMVSNIDGIPDSVEQLDTCRCHVEIVKKIPSSLRIWKSFNASIESIECEFPKGLENLDLYGNRLACCPDLPDGIEEVDLGNNNLLSVPKFPRSIRILDLKNNSALNIEELARLSDEFPRVKIHYTNPMRDKSEGWLPFMWTSPHDATDSPVEKMEFRYSELNPHYIPLDKTYCV